MRGPHPPLPHFADAAGGLGGDGGGDDDSPRCRRLPPTHAVEANPVFPDDDDPNTNQGDNSDPPSAAFPGAVPARKKKRSENLAPCRCPVCGKRFSHPKALYGHMRCHPDRTWRGITPPVSEEEAAASLANLSSGEGARAKRYVCFRCGRGFETRQGLGGHRASHKSVQGCHARSLEGRKGSGVHGARNVRRGSGDEGGKQMMIGQKRSGAGRWKASKEAETAEAAAERRGLLPDLNVPVPAPEDTEDGSSSGIIDLNKKLPGQDDE